MRAGLNKSSQTILIGANSEIGNQILYETKIGEDLPRFYFGRSIPGWTFRKVDIFKKFDALKIEKAKIELLNVLQKNNIECVIMSFASMDYSTLKKSEESNLVNFNCPVVFTEILIQYFREKYDKTKQHGTIIYVSSSITDLNPRLKNFKYTASKIATEYYLKGLSIQEKYSKTNTRIIIIKPGFIRTKIHQNESAGPFAIDTENLGRSIRRSIRFNRSIIYAPILIKIPLKILSYFPSRTLNWLDRLQKNHYNSEISKRYTKMNRRTLT
jgi:short-subunit dehydrogenase